MLQTLALASAILVSALSLRADESGQSTCGLAFTVRGEIAHARLPYDRRVEGATDDVMYVEEITGKEFSAFVPGLPEGAYSVEIYLAETRHSVAGKRVFDISTDKVVLAQDLDLFAVAGNGREHVVTGAVYHEEDSINGPLSIRFEAKKDNAKVNAIRIRNADGQIVACVMAKDLVSADDLLASAVPEVADAPIYFDAGRPVAQRVADLVRRMSVREKVGQLMDNSPAIERLGLPGYNYWNECLHGVGRAGHATVFPQAIGMAASWDPELLHTVADVIATEGRAKNNAARERNPNTNRYYGLTFWTPNINIFRDPRWGRGQETYGEDPYLAARLGVAFIRGLQGDDPTYYKAAATAKHFAVHSGPEKLRHGFDAVVSKRDLYETYLPHFEAAVREGQVAAVMSVYNALYGVPGPANHFLLTEILRERWGFAGHVTSDCGAVRDVWRNHKYVATAEEASAASIKAGNDLNCGSTYAALTRAVNQGLLTEADLDRALSRVLEVRFRLGLFDTPERCAYLRIPTTENDTPTHSELALKMARESIVLLKNDGVLPLDKAKIKRLAVIGPNADAVSSLLGNYNGDPSHPVTVLQGLRAELGDAIEIVQARGCSVALETGATFSVDEDFNTAVEAARSADVVVFVGGLDPHLEGEEMRNSAEGFDRGDRSRIELPQPQHELLKALCATGRPVVFVNLSGGAVAMPWEAENIGAILQAWYPGQNGGTAVADALFGRFNPSGRLPVTVYRSTEDLPAFEDYAMTGRTYRYFAGKPLFSFGHGLSYTTFEYGAPVLSAPSMSVDGRVIVKVDVTNTGSRDGAEVVQVYVRHVDSPIPQPIHSLAAFKRVDIASGATERVVLEVPASALRFWDEKAEGYVVPAGEFEIEIGSSSSDVRRVVRARVAP